MIHIIGIDGATQSKKTGLAWGCMEGDAVRVQEAVAVADFLQGAALPPGDKLGLARREGWIWVRRPG